MNSGKNPINTWTAEDENEHFPSIIEWWCAEGFIKTKESNNKWCFKTAFSEWFQNKPKKIGSHYILSLFDQNSKKHSLSYYRNDLEKLKSEKDFFFIKFKDYYIKGKYPDYEMILKNKEKNIKLHLKYRANSLPYWVTQQITGGYIPMGIGSYRYGFIPNGLLSGKMEINNEIYSVTGRGYYEHIWGNFSYTDPLKNLSEIKNTLDTCLKLFKWRFKNSKIKIPKSIGFCTENNPLGYDWIWAVFDNEWSLFYGNILFWIMKGPAFGTLILTKDGKNYIEFNKIHFNYNKIVYSENFDFYYPTEIELKVESNSEKLFLKFSMDVDALEYIHKFRRGKFFLGFVICEAPGTVEGIYINGNEKIKLKGFCKMEPQRQLSYVGHNQLKLDFLLPPNGFGIKINFDSHLLRKKIVTNLQLAPSLKFGFNMKKIESSKINDNRNIKNF